MNQDIKKRWVTALRSGEYDQVEGYLALKDEGFCCLGVLCEIALADGVIAKIPARTGSNIINYMDHGDDEGWDTELPSAVVAWAGLPDNNPDVEVTAPEGWTSNQTLSGLNDDLKWDFKKIATVIEEQL